MSSFARRHITEIVVNEDGYPGATLSKSKALITTANPTFILPKTDFPPRNGVRPIAIEMRANIRPNKTANCSGLACSPRLARICCRAASMQPSSTHDRDAIHQHYRELDSLCENPRTENGNCREHSSQLRDVA